MDADHESRPPRRSLLRRAVPYVLSCALIGIGLFFGAVAQRMVVHQETFTDAVVRQIVHVPTPEEVFHRDRIYVMLLGIDYDYDDKDQPFSSHARSDTIMAAGIDFPTKSTRLVSVLRDSDVTINGRDTKINAAYSYGGVKLADSVVGDFLGMPAEPNGKHFDRYVVVRVNALKDFVDAIGGIDVPVTETMNYDDTWGHLHIHFKPGMYHMNGDQVQGYSRFRHDECSDPCRTKRQQQVMKILADKLVHDKVNDLTHIGQLIAVFRRDVTTNLSTDELKSLAWSFKDAKIADLAHADTIGYVDTKETLDGETVIPNERQKTELVADMLGPYQTVAPPAAPPTRAVAAVVPSTVHVVVENGSGIRGAATVVAATLRTRGYVIDGIANADSFSYDTTLIRTAVPDAGARVRADIGIAGASVAPRGAKTPSDGAVHVIVGRDYALQAQAATMAP
ncbi:MAG TPA: LCP family protein [Candidatus Elarobacter sp.]|jgi:LCP family protein required for cell wall assembly|nr:LCP family protein [Candidatus Elarobacter sp.]